MRNSDDTCADSPGRGRADGKFTMAEKTLTPSQWRTNRREEIGDRRRGNETRRSFGLALPVVVCDRARRDDRLQASLTPR
jgi:hypothetical protein